jgi:AcrR family transcriptional regulator
MSGEERRLAIIKVATPLFAEKGFDGTSIREIARAANVSEALLYKHFPSKEALYSEILEFTTRISSFTIKEFMQLEPGTETLVIFIYVFFHIILFKVPGLREEQEMYEWLFFRSLLGDVSYAKTGFRTIMGNMRETILTNYDAAVSAGDIVEMRVDPINLFWFIHHLAMGLDLCHKSGEPAFQYDSSKEELAEHAVKFCLRGIGMTDEAIRKYFNTSQLRAFKNEILK